MFYLGSNSGLINGRFKETQDAVDKSWTNFFRKSDVMAPLFELVLAPEAIPNARDIAPTELTVERKR